MNINNIENQFYFLEMNKALSKISENADIRKDFPILSRTINNKPLIWFDNAATTQKPLCVIDALNNYYSQYNSNVHRGAHTLAKEATKAYDEAREKVKRFIGAASSKEIIFVRGATEAINLAANSFGRFNIEAGDEIILTCMEHHSNIVPWQKISRLKGATIKVVPINSRGEINIDEYEKLLSYRTRMVAIGHVSNILGTVNPVHQMIDLAHRYGAWVLIDGAQSLPHMGIDVSGMDADFFVFSGHKCYGPTGIGVLYGKKALLEEMPPWQTGGGMIKNVTFDDTEFNTLPHKFEAGTGNIGDAIALGAAIDYLQSVGMDRVEQHERAITTAAIDGLSKIPGLKLIGTAQNKISVVSFIMDNVDSQDAAHLLNEEGIAVRSGHHCAQPALNSYGLTSCIRASLGIYNTMEEVEHFIDVVKKISR